MSKNVIKTFVFMAALGVLLMWVGDMLMDGKGVLLFFFIALALNFATYWWSDKIVLKMTRAQPVTEQEAPWLYRIVRELSVKANIPMPRLYKMPAAQPNAFATGRDPEHAAVAVT